MLVSALSTATMAIDRYSRDYSDIHSDWPDLPEHYCSCTRRLLLITALLVPGARLLLTQLLLVLLLIHLPLMLVSALSRLL